MAERYGATLLLCKVIDGSLKSFMQTTNRNTQILTHSGLPPKNAINLALECVNLGLQVLDSALNDLLPYLVGRGVLQVAKVVIGVWISLVRFKLSLVFLDLV